MTTNSIEQYQNIVLLIEPILKFYANDNNYVEYMGNISMIAADEHGSQARFALTKIEELLNSNTSFGDELSNKIAEMTGIVDNLDTMNEDEILNALKSLK